MKNLKPIIYSLLLLLSFSITAQTRVIRNKTKIRGSGAIENTAPDSLLTYGSDRTLNYTRLTDFATKIQPLLSTGGSSTYDINTSEELTNKTFENSPVYVQMFLGTGMIQVDNLPAQNDPFQTLSINQSISIVGLDDIVESTLHFRYRNYESPITALNSDEYSVAWDGTDWVVTEDFGGANDVGVINPSDNLVYTDDSYSTLVTDGALNQLPAAVVSIDGKLTVDCAIKPGTSTIQFLSTSNLVDQIEIYKHFVVIEYTKI